MCLYRLKANSLTCNRAMFLKKVQVTLLTFFAACFKAAGRWTVILDLTGLPAMAWKRAHIRTVSFYNVSKTCSTLQLCLWLCFEIVGLLNDSILGSFREKKCQLSTPSCNRQQNAAISHFYVTNLPPYFLYYITSPLYLHEYSRLFKNVL